MTKRRRHAPEQIIRKLAEGNKLLAGGAGLDEVCRHLQVADELPPVQRTGWLRDHAALAVS